MSPDSTNSAAGRPYFGRVEAIRGLGSLVVAGYHFTGLAFPMAGHAALMAFFVISGFVLRVALEHGPRTIPAMTGKFVIARVFRVYPIVVVGMLVVWMTATEDGITVRRLAANFLLLDVSMNSHLWALQVEMLMIPVIIVLYLLERRLGPVVLAVVALVTTGLAFSTRWAVWPPLSTNLFAFVLGMTLPTLGKKFATGLSRSGATLWLAGSAVILMATSSCFGFYSRYSSVTEAYVAAGALSLVAYRPDLSALRWLDNHWLRKLGVASGSYYVLHMALIPPFSALAIAVTPTAWITAAPATVILAQAIIWLLAIAPLMMVVSAVVEAPGIALGRRLIRVLLTPRPVPAEPEPDIIKVDWEKRRPAKTAA